MSKPKVTLATAASMPNLYPDENGLLNALARHVAGYRSVLTFAADFVDFVNINNTTFCTLNIKISGLNKL